VAGKAAAASVAAEELERFSFIRKQFCFSGGAAIQAEGGAERIRRYGQAGFQTGRPPPGNPKDGQDLGQILGKSPRPYTGYALREFPGPSPKPCTAEWFRM